MDLLDPGKYQPKVVLEDLYDPNDQMGNLEIDLEPKDSQIKDPDYRPLVNIFPTTSKRRSPRLQAKASASATVSVAPYSPSEDMDDMESISSEVAVTVSDPPSPQYFVDTSDESSDEFDSPQPINISPKPIPVIITNRSPSPFPIPIKLNDVALYPRETEEPHLRELSYYPKLRYWHKGIDVCECQIPNQNECLAEFYFKFGSCPLTQATNFMNESPKLIIEHNSVEMFRYYVAHPELESLVKALHYLPRGISDIESSFAICKIVDSYLLMVHLDVLVNRCKIEIFATLPICYNRMDITLRDRCSSAYLYIAKCLHEMLIKVKFADKQNAIFTRWISSDEIKW